MAAAIAAVAVATAKAEALESVSTALLSRAAELAARRATNLVDAARRLRLERRARESR